MKRVFVILLAAVLCVSLAACGEKGGETDADGSQEPSAASAASAQDADGTDDKAQTKQTIEVTLDNWQEYFEIREYLGSSIVTNDFGEPTKYFYDVFTLFAVKEELAENVVSCDVVIEYDADSSPKNISFNAKDMTFEITGDCENEFIPDDYLDSSRFTRGATAKLGDEYIHHDTFKDGKVESVPVIVPYSTLISGFDNNSTNGASILNDDKIVWSEWKENNEGYILKYTENVRITRIQGKLVLNQ